MIVLYVCGKDEPILLIGSASQAGGQDQPVAGCRFHVENFSEKKVSFELGRKRMLVLLEHVAW